MNKNKWISVLLVLTFLMGLSLVLYPSFSDYWNSTRQSSAIAFYVEEINTMEQERKQAMMDEARAYNEALKERSNVYVLPDELRLRYSNTLNASGTGIMAYVEIPSINVMLPGYHGTSDAVLQTAVGHIEWTSLPIGGKGTHTVISGHRGLPSARLFTDLDKVVEGDTFLLQVVDETLTYEVDQILIVEPETVKDLAPTEDKDYCTLVTCTPYAVNTHRLLVRGHRVENQVVETSVRLVSEASKIEPMLVASVVAVPLILLLLTLYLLDDWIWGKKKKEIASWEELV